MNADPVVSIEALSLRSHQPDHRKDYLLHNISLNLSEQELLILTGSSGSGKTSVLNCIAGLAPISNGHIQFNHQPLEKLSKRPLTVKKDIQQFSENSRMSGMTYQK